MEKDNTLEIRINKFSLGNKAIFIFWLNSILHSLKLAVRRTTT